MTQGVLIGQKLLDQQGQAIGKITDVIVDSATLEQEWITVKTGLLGGEHLVPIEAVQETPDGVTVPFDKQEIKEAPTVNKGHAAPSDHERQAIFQHFQMEDPKAGRSPLG